MNDYLASTLSEPEPSSPFGSSDVVEVDNTVEDIEPHRVRVLSWNIDGLDHNSLDLRMRAVCQIIDE